MAPRRWGAEVVIGRMAVLPMTVFAGSDCEQLVQIGECLELERVSRGVEEEHGPLFARFALEPDVGFDHELRADGGELVGEDLELVDR